MKTNELTGSRLDYWVALAEGYTSGAANYRPSTDWQQAGELLEKYDSYGVTNMGTGITHHVITVIHSGDKTGIGEGPTACMSICRAVVALVYDEEVDDG